MYTVGTQMSAQVHRASIRVRTFKAEGRVLSRLAHDLQLRLDDFDLRAGDGKVSLGFSPASLIVEGAIVDGVLSVQTLSDRHQEEIRSNIRNDVLHTARHPTGSFEGSYAERDDCVRVEGVLRLRGESRSVEFELFRTPAGYDGSVRLVPSRWGIAPFTAMLGALRLQDRVDVLVHVAVENG